MLKSNLLSLNMRQLLLGGFLLLILSSCKKESSNDPVIPPTGDSTDPVQYETPFAGVPNTSDIVMYEINERAFRVLPGKTFLPVHSFPFLMS